MDNPTPQTETFDFGKGPVAASKHPNGGGWVAATAKVDPTAYVGPLAQVYDNARVTGTARVSGIATVSGEAHVTGNARVTDKAYVSGDSVIRSGLCTRQISRSPIVLSGFPFLVTIMDETIQIGCKNLTPDEWATKGPEIFAKEGHEEMAETHLPILLSIAKLHCGN